MENKTAIFYGNAYFDDIVGFLHADVHTWQDKYKPFTCNQCGKKLYETKDNKNKSDFVAVVNSRLGKITRPQWPYKGKLFIQIAITNTESKIAKTDIDNLIKTVLDSIKGQVFVDDSQVVSVYADKDYLKEAPISSFVFGIKELQPGERAEFQSSLWSGDEAYTKGLRLHREAIGMPSLFHIFTLESDHKIVVTDKQMANLNRRYKASQNKRR